jgi:hypothetical protein
MEIVTYVIEGALEHRDSLGNGKIIRLDELLPKSGYFVIFRVKIAPNVLLCSTKNRENPLSLGMGRKAGSPTGCGFGFILEISPLPHNIRA